MFIRIRDVHANIRPGVDLSDTMSFIPWRLILYIYFFTFNASDVAWPHKN